LHTIQVKLSIEGRGTDQETKSAENGDFSFLNVAPGRYQLSFSAKDFAAKTITGDLPGGETVDLPPTVLSVATLNAGVNVSDNQAEIAEAEIKVQEQQRIFGLVPISGAWCGHFDGDADFTSKCRSASSKRSRAFAGGKSASQRVGCHETLPGQRATA
jgi:hypothetical protein